MKTCIDGEVLCGEQYVVVQLDREKGYVIMVPCSLGSIPAPPFDGWENAKGALVVPWAVREATQ